MKGDEKNSLSPGLSVGQLSVKLPGTAGGPKGLLR